MKPVISRHGGLILAFPFSWGIRLLFGKHEAMEACKGIRQYVSEGDNIVSRDFDRALSTLQLAT